jgi:hypothetical protein
MISRPYKNFQKKLFVKKLIILTYTLSYTCKYTAIRNQQKLWITFPENIFRKSYVFVIF